RRHLDHRQPRLYGDHRPRQGRDQVRRRMDQLHRRREHRDGAPLRRLDGGDRRGASQMGRTPAAHRADQARHAGDARRDAGLSRRQDRQMVDARRRRLRGRDSAGRDGQGRQEGRAPAIRRLQASGVGLMQTLLPLAEQIAERLKARGETVAVAESSSGGLISAALLAVPGASAYYRGGAVVYTAKARVSLMHLERDAVAGMRSASEPYALLLARTARANLDATWGVSETGASGPSGNPYGDAAGHSCIG